MTNLLRSRDNGLNFPGLSFGPSMAFSLRAQGVQIGCPVNLSLHSYYYAPHKKAGCRLDDRRSGCTGPSPMDGASQIQNILAFLIPCRVAGQHHLPLLADQRLEAPGGVVLG